MRSILDDLAALDLFPLDDMDGGRFEDALEGPDAPRLVRPGDVQRPLFTEERGESGPWSGSEVETFGLLSRATGETLVWWNSNATGIAKGVVIERPEPAAVQEAVAALYAGVGWALGNVIGTEFVNEAPDLLPRAFFVRLLAEAGERHPSTLSDGDEAWESFDAWLDANYREAE